MGRLLLPWNKTLERRTLFQVGRHMGGGWGSINNSDIRYGFVFRAPTGGDTLAKIWADHLSTNGTQTNIGEWAVYTVNSSLEPDGTAIYTQIHTPSSSYVGVTMDTPPSLSSETLYACVLRNRASEVSLDPASNYFSVVHGPTSGGHLSNETLLLRSSNAGSTWEVSDCLSRDPHFYPEFGTLGTYAFGVSANSTMTARKIYNDTTNIRWNGNKIRQPYDGIPVLGYGFLSANGSATFECRMDIFDENDNLLASSLPSAGRRNFPFDTDVRLKRGRLYTWAYRAIDNPVGSSSVYYTTQGQGSSAPTDLASEIQGVYSESGTTPSWTNTSPYMMYGVCEAIEDRPRIWRLGAS